MSKLDDAIEGLEKVWDVFDHAEHELYADYVFDALFFLKEYKQHLQDDLSKLKNDVLRIENEINCNSDLMIIGRSVDAFIKWCSESHMMGNATLKGIEYWVGKYKEQL